MINSNNSMKDHKVTYRHLCRQSVSTLVICLLYLISTVGFKAAAAEQSTLDELLSQIDMELYEHSEQDVRAWLDGMIETYGPFGVYPDHTSRVLRIDGDRARLSLGDGWAAEFPAMLFRAYEMFNEPTYLQAALRFCDHLVSAQCAEGHFPDSITVRRGQSASRGRSNSVRLQDRYNFPYFALLLYGYRHSGNEAYLNAARKHADLLYGIQNPVADSFWMGPWPDEVSVRHAIGGVPKETSAGRGGVTAGYSLNDYATYDAYRTMVMMYFVTRDQKYIHRIERLPLWICAAQLGLGNVRGWTEEYGVHNEPVWARRFESTLIDPRNFNRFTGPMLIQFYAITGNEVYRNLFLESYEWLRSMEHVPDREPKEGELVRGDWAYKFTYDGREAWSGRPAYTDRLTPGETFSSITGFPGGNVHLDSMQMVYELIKKEDLEGLRAWFGPYPTRYGARDYLRARIEAAQRATDEKRQVLLQVLPDEDGYMHERRMGSFMERVRLRLVHPDNAPQRDPVPRMAGRQRNVARDLQIWRPSSGRSPYKPQYGWATWQYVWDVRLALGKIDPANAAPGGRGFESEGPPTTFFERWDVRGDWFTRAITVENWLDMPFRDLSVPVRTIHLSPDRITLKAGDEQDIEMSVTPRNATCRSAVWSSDNAEVATIEARMLDDIDPEKQRPVYRLEGRMVVEAHSPGKATITARSTCGGHVVSVAVEVLE